MWEGVGRRLPPAPSRTMLSGKGSVIMHVIKRLLASQDGNSIVEYGLLLGLLSALLIVSFADLRESFLAVLVRVADCLNGVVSGRGC